MNNKLTNKAKANYFFPEGKSRHIFDGIHVYPKFCAI